MAKWNSMQSPYGDKISSTGSMLKQKDLERAEIEEHIAKYLQENEITKIPYGVRMDKPRERYGD